MTNPLRQPVSTPESGADCGAAGTGDGEDDDSDEVVDDGCPSRIYVYDEVGRLESEIDALGRTTAFEYYADSTLKTRTDARDLVTEYTYDAAGQLDLIEYMDGETVVSDVDYGYDDVGNRTSMIDDTGTTSYTYDDLNRLTEVEYPDLETVAYRYDNTGGMGEDPAEYPGQRTKITYPDSKTVVYTYEEDGRMATVTDWDSNVTSYSYGDSGRLESIELPNTVTATYEYDAAGRLVELENADDTPAVLSSYDYTLDAVGNRTQMVDTSGTTSYDYDAGYQLTDVTYPNDDEATYSYDAMGNRLSVDFNESTTEYDYDAADQLTDVDMVSYTYDDSGNLTARGSDTFAWDYEDRLTDAEIDSVDSSFEYNGDGLRVSRTFDTATVDYYWDVGSGLPVVLQDSDGNTYIYGLDLIARVDGQGDEEYYLYDGLGSVTGICDDTGTVTDTYSYDVFGAPRATTGSSANEFTFTGEQVDPTGLQYLRARYYDPAVGRFLSEDPLGLMQRYPYAGNNPATLVDPSGLSATEGLWGGCGPGEHRIYPVPTPPQPIGTPTPDGYFGPPVSSNVTCLNDWDPPSFLRWLSDAVQVADLLPSGTVAGPGTIVGIALDVGAFIAAEIDLIRSNCRGELGLHLTTLLNLGEGLAGNALPPANIWLSISESGLYTGNQFALQQC